MIVNNDNTDEINNRYKLIDNTTNVINYTVDDTVIDVDNDDDCHTIMRNRKRKVTVNVLCKMCNINEFDEKKVVYKKVSLTTIESLVAIIYCYYFERIIHNSFCAWLFLCHCTWSWKGGWKDW